MVLVQLIGVGRGIAVVASSTKASNVWLMVVFRFGVCRRRGWHLDSYALKIQEETAVHQAAVSHAPCPAPQKGLTGGS